MIEKDLVIWFCVNILITLATIVHDWSILIIYNVVFLGINLIIWLFGGAEDDD